MKKKVRVEISDKVLKGIPEDERADLVKEIREMFENAEPGELPGQEVHELQEGVDRCVFCCGPLVPGPVITLSEGSVTQIFDCEECGEAFRGAPLN